MGHPAFGRLEPLLGEWRTEAIVGGRSMGIAATRFAWTEDGAFLRQRTEDAESFDADWAAHSPLPVTALIGLDDTADAFTMLYADAREVFRVYRFDVRGGVWTMSRDAAGFNQRFSATFAADGRTIEGAWETSPDGTAWTKDFDVRYTRAS
ncbi:hypothetical protein [Actinomadura rayongensis]|uniref:hypothetical protein n=1 Tax=Actinomadura rayongensis TaxID=1429076 RepID=UPI0019296B69|nr:hypothetical protein [Actinomadura rayongensis]